MVSHWDERNKELLLTLRVWINGPGTDYWRSESRSIPQVMNTRSEWKPTDVCTLWLGQRDSSPKELPDQGKEEKRLMIGQNPKAEVAPSSVSRNRGKENQFWNWGRREQMGESRAKLQVKKAK